MAIAGTACRVSRGCVTRLSEVRPFHGRRAVEQLERGSPIAEYATARPFCNGLFADLAQHGSAIAFVWLSSSLITY